MGARVGCSEGDDEGFVVGVGDGGAVGEPEGVAEGCLVGAPVGRTGVAVGAPVGSWLGEEEKFCGKVEFAGQN